MKTILSKHKSILGLGFEGETFSATEIEFSDQQFTVKHSLFKTLSQDLLTGNPELVGTEIRKHLEEAEIRERHCVVCIPLSWVYILHIRPPSDLTEEDRESYIRLRAEREFPYPTEDLFLSTIHSRKVQEGELTIVAAVPVQHIIILQKVLKAAGLRARSLTLGISSLLSMDNALEALTLAVHEKGIDMGIVGRAGPALIRFLPDVINAGTEGDAIDGEMLVREIKITLARLPKDVKEGIQFIRILGNGVSGEILSELEEELSPLGMQIKREEAVLSGSIQGKVRLPYPFSASIGYLSGSSPLFEFLPPAINRIKKLMGRVSAKGVFWLSATSGAIILVILLAFLIQSRYLAGLKRKWGAMEPGARKVEVLKEKLRKYRAWNEDSIQSLSLIRDITKAFPENGDVWVRTIQVRDMSEVQFSGEAKSNTVFLEMLAKLGKMPSTSDLKVMQLREGKGALEFTIKFQWKGSFNGV